MEQDEASRIRALGEIAAEFDLDAIRVRTGEVEIEIVRRDPTVHAAPIAYLPQAGQAPAAPPAADPAAPAGSGSSPAALPRGARAVQAPVVGVFYRAASPGSDPFVDVGRRVKVGEVLCILEAMKLMNEITADVAGTVVRIIPENGELVSLGQDLFWIEP
jgi:acetyl-CoA carboxylase biotin carboxyl carrier protein